MARARVEPATTAPEKDDGREAAGLLDEVAAIVCLAAAAFLAVSFAAYQNDLPHLNVAGRVGRGLADVFVQALGYASYLLPVYLLLGAVALFRHAAGAISVARAVAAGVLLLCVAVLIGLGAPPPPARPVTLAGGWLGGFLAALLAEPFGAGGSVIVVGGLAMLAFLVATRLSLGGLARAAGQGIAGTVRRVRTVDERGEPDLPLPPLARKPKANVKREALPMSAAAPLIVLADLERTTPAQRRRPRLLQAELPFGDDRYQAPPLRLLHEEASHDAVRVDEDALRRSSQILEAKLADFAIVGKVVEVRPGPVITTFDIEPAPGVKVNRITSLGDDLAMALRVPGVRILAPVPGKAVVGIEVANPKRESVLLRELVEADDFQHSTSPLALALGKDTAGHPVIGDLAKMPHLMVAGATGSGKSVAINAMIMSILYKAPPREVRFVMIDMKMLELSVYEDIPHLLVPVVTDPKQAVAVLNNIVELMEERYRLMKKHGVRNIDGYNKLIDEQRARDQGGEVIELAEAVEGEDDEEVVTPPALPERLPKVVVIVDELADLMMTMGRKVEEPITRLAQKARAAGVHLIIATQRPSVDVITGLIKANFPSRISFQVTARVDSRTILDHIGAERLLGRGDMLYMSSGSARVQRLHGPLVTEEEIHKVVTFIKKQGKPQYVFNLLEAPDGEEEAIEDELSDELYDQAVHLVTTSRQASISWVQRKLRVGYNRAARMIERMEREGVVSASDNGRPREVLAQAVGPE